MTRRNATSSQRDEAMKEHAVAADAGWDGHIKSDSDIYMTLCKSFWTGESGVSVSMGLLSRSPQPKLWRLPGRNNRALLH